MLSSKLTLRKVRCRLLSDPLNEDCENEIHTFCADVIKNNASSAEDRAWAYYYLGLIKLHHAKRTGILRKRWQGSVEECRSSDEAPENSACLQDAEEYFVSAGKSRPMCGDILSRNISRCLALVLGPEDSSAKITAGLLVLSSIGFSSRALMKRLLHEAVEESEDASVVLLLQVFSVFDSDFANLSDWKTKFETFLALLSKLIPENWKFVAPVVCPTGEMLLTSVEKSRLDGQLKVVTSCVFPNGDTESAYDDIVKPLDAIISRSQEQLHGMDQSAVSERFAKESAKRKWWNDRNQLDSDLHDLVERAEFLYFSSLHLKSSALEDGSLKTVSIFEEDDSLNLPCGNLASKFEAACNISNDSESSDEAEAASLKKLTIPKLKAQLHKIGVPDTRMRRLRKQELITMLINEQKYLHKEDDKPQNGIRDGRGCLFLILDEDLHGFPFEGMRSLEGRAVCRTPGLPFVYATLVDNATSKGSRPLIDPSETSYVLDPENNLNQTRRRLQPMLEDIPLNKGWNWKGSIGEIPLDNFFEAALEKNDGLLMYFGHGGAQCCFSRRQVNEMILKKKREDSDAAFSPRIRSCRAAIILMGCSSGRLISINKKHSQSLEQIPLHYEPEGIALSYLCAGSPCVVGNLWDVTDHDIDR